MNRFKTPILFLLILAIFGAGTAGAQSSEGDDRDALLRALLQEIRLLRQTLERSQLFELRASITLDQMQVTQSSVDKLRQRITDLRQQTSYDSMEEFEFYVEEVKQRFARETDPAAREQIQREIEMIQKRREIQEKRRSDLQSQIQQLELRLREEEDKLLALEGDLDRLQRSLISETN